MTILLRRAKLAEWSSAGADPERRAAAIGSFERRPEDSDGLSVFEARNDAEQHLVIAAIACMRGNDGAVDLLEIPRELAEEFGPIEPTPGHGGTPIPGANALHRSLNWGNDQLKALAEALIQRKLLPTRHSRATVRAAVAKLVPERDVEQGATDAKAFVEEVRRR